MGLVKNATIWISSGIRSDFNVEIFGNLAAADLCKALKASLQLKDKLIDYIITVPSKRTSIFLFLLHINTSNL